MFLKSSLVLPILLFSSISLDSKSGISLVPNRKGEYQGCILSPCLFNLYAEYIMWNAGLDEAQAGIKIARKIINNLRHADYTTLMAEREELKSLLMPVKEESEKAGLKLNIQKAKIMASSSITWQKIWKQWEILFWGAPKSLQMVTAAMKLKDTRCLKEKLWPTSFQFSSVSVVSNSLQPHESQHTRPLCPSPTPWVHSDSPT